MMRIDEDDERCVNWDDKSQTSVVEHERRLRDNEILVRVIIFLVESF